MLLKLMQPQIFSLLKLNKGQCWHCHKARNVVQLIVEYRKLITFHTNRKSVMWHPVTLASLNIKQPKKFLNILTCIKIKSCSATSNHNRSHRLHEPKYRYVSLSTGWFAMCLNIIFIKNFTQGKLHHLPLLFCSSSS